MVWWSSIPKVTGNLIHPSRCVVLPPNLIKRGVKRVKPVSPNLHLVKCRDEQDLCRTPVVNQYPSHIEIGNGDGDDQRIIMWEMQASQIIVGDGDGLVNFSQRR